MRKLLIANRGEIAVRIMRTAKEMGIRTVAIASEADRRSLHARFADECVVIGPAPASESYLCIEKVLAAARETNTDALHPGYGFLAERPEFAEACESEGVTFVGPSASAMRLLGSKIEAKRLAESLGVPLVPGAWDLASRDEYRKAASNIGYPVLLKASAGGGGRGMRIVSSEAEFDAAWDVASAEAAAAFGDGTIFLEKFVANPHHVEVQVLADRHGAVHALFERECSVQRRHQKLLEESPSPLMNADLWGRMEECSRRLVEAAGYVGAGTIEFIVNPNSREFYFLEVNTRLQVEHPVTEMVAGVDLVAWQLRIADGGRLEGPQPPRERLRGHAFEARILAEDPRHGFLPSAGQILAWHEPKGPGIRVDSGFGLAETVSRHYDSLLAKLIVWGETREAARHRLIRALEGFHVIGVHTNVEFLLALARDERFVQGEVDTGYVEREFAPQWRDEIPDYLTELARVGLAGSSEPTAAALESPAWSVSDGFRVA